MSNLSLPSSNREDVDKGEQTLSYEEKMGSTSLYSLSSLYSLWPTHNKFERIKPKPSSFATKVLPETSCVLWMLHVACTSTLHFSDCQCLLLSFVHYAGTHANLNPERMKQQEGQYTLKDLYIFSSKLFTEVNYSSCSLYVIIFSLL